MTDELSKHILKKHELDGFTLFESLYPSRLKQPRHTHRLASFSFVLAGSYVERFGRCVQTRRPSTVIFHPPQESHAVDFDNEAVRILSVEVGFSRLDYLRRHSIVLDSSASCRTETIAWLGRRIHKEFRRMDNTSPLAIEGLVFEILAEASRTQSNSFKSRTPRWLAQSREFLHDNFSESLALEDIAKTVGVHPVHLARVFREQYGCTVGEYLRRLRIEFACQKISTTDMPLSEIAHAAGFADHSHLSKTFKHHFGLTPSAYRKISRRS